MWELIGIIVAVLIAYFIATMIITGTVEFFAGAETVKTPPVVAAITVSAVLLLALIAFLFRSIPNGLP